MTVIDWTKPVETDETPKRPARVICTDRKSGGAYVVVALVPDQQDGEEWVVAATLDGMTRYGYRLRNVAPKPREIWVNDCEGVLGSLAFKTREGAEINAARPSSRRAIRFVEAPEEPAPADDGWIPWHGGECPVAWDALVDVKLRSNVVASGCACAFHSWGWQYPAQPGEIVAYRLSERSKASANEEWIPKDGIVTRGFSERGK